MGISKLHFITNHRAGEFNEKSLIDIIDGGVDWIQFRMKDVDPEIFLHEAIKVQEICKKYSVTFIVNDNVEVAKQIGADGVHIGKNDISVTEARNILGDNYIIGGTANTIDDVKNLHFQGVDYIGLGPYKFTTTKKLLSPILGVDGYFSIVNACKVFNINIPIVAIGGIEIKDIKPIIHTGIYGIAISGLLHNSLNKKDKAALICSEIKS